MRTVAEPLVPAAMGGASGPAVRTLPDPDPGRSLHQNRLTVPMPTVATIARPRILRLLNEATRRAVTVVTGGPGAGKTLAVADWVRRGRPPGPVVWVCLTGMEADAGRLRTTLLSAAADLLPVQDIAQPPGRVLGSGSIPHLLARLAERGTVLVLDDAQLIEGGTSQAMLESVLRNLPAGLHLVLIARHDPALPLQRLRVAGALSDIRSADLAFTTAEAQQLFAVRDRTLGSRGGSTDCDHRRLALGVEPGCDHLGRSGRPGPCGGWFRWRKHAGG